MMRTTFLLFCILGMSDGASAATIDHLIMGDPASEMTHGLKADHSEVVEGGLGEPARRFLPRDEESWRGGSAKFRMAVDPGQRTYCTVKLWGGYAAKEDAGRMALFIEGKQVGQRHLGEIDMLDVARDEPRFAGRFLYKTVPLPLAMTRGQETVELAIEGQGGIWAYGNTADKFQHMMEIPSRGVYRVYTHTGPFFEPPAEDPQGAAVTKPPTRAAPGKEVISKVEERANSELVKLLKGEEHMGQHALSFMARAYHEPWTKAYRSKDFLEKIVKGIDCQYRVFTGELERTERDAWDEGWIGFGRAADAVRLLADELKPYLDQPITGTEVPRRQGWVKMFAASRDLHVGKRRQYTNQSMIVDTYGIYLCHRGVAALDPSKAWPEKKALRLLHESMGIEPWSGKWDEQGTPTWRMGRDYRQLTDAGLSKELGYVGNYGEAVISLGTAIYDATRPAYGAEGDPRLKEQLIKMARARAVFRHPAVDVDGNRAMRIETVIGWRDYYFPGTVTYDERPDRESMPFGAAAATQDPALVGYCQHMLEDNQYFAALEYMMKNSKFEVTAVLLDAPGAYRTIAAQPRQSTRVPMATGQPDFIFSDPEAGVVTVKNGDEVLFVSLYWRARYAINNLAKIHHLTPTIERDVVAWQQTRFKDSGEVFVMPDQANEPFNRRHEKFYKASGIHLAEAGIEQPIARVPAQFKDYRPGKENIHAGKGTSYVLQYGSYLVAMNCTRGEAFSFEVPEAFRGATDLVSSAVVETPSFSVEPWQTVVLFRNR